MTGAEIITKMIDAGYCLEMGPHAAISRVPGYYAVFYLPEDTFEEGFGERCSDCDEIHFSYEDARGDTICRSRSGHECSSRTRNSLSGA